MIALVTGGAGFIGSHIVDALLADGHRVRVLDDLSMGLKENLADEVDFVEGSITDPAIVESVARGCEVIFHEAALGSVRRSIEAPRATDVVNVHGSLNVLEAARTQGVRRVITASSSSVYGGIAPLPAHEDFPPAPRSPYAVSKVAAEHYARVYSELMGVETVILRYFNVFGPRQRADSPYAAVIPLFVDALERGNRPVIYGDGEQSRDFTFVADTVRANLLAASAPADTCSGRTYNVAGGSTYSVASLLAEIAEIMGVVANPEFAGPRPGDIRDSYADLTRVRTELGYEPRTPLREGLRHTIRPEA